MKTIFLLLNISLIGIQSLSAQTGEVDKTNVKINNEYVDVVLYPNPVEDVLNLKSNANIDFIRLYDKHGQLVEQFIPIDNKINLDGMASGIYMACACIEGKTIKKSILKKM